jgi:RNA polymerase sigma-70 factor (ECF subfamily)
MSSRLRAGLTGMESTIMTGRPEDASIAAALRTGDEATFTGLAAAHRRELLVHCYRMMGSRTDAEDVVQDALLRAWRHRDTYQGLSTFRAWLYRIATNACLDAIERRQRAAPSDSATAADLPWLEPIPDAWLDAAAQGPDAAVIARETIELAFLVAIQVLPPRQRAVLIARDVLGWSAQETAVLLDASLASVNSALQRARAVLAERAPARRDEWAPGADPTVEERALLQRYVEATERGDLAGLAALLGDDVRFTMPPEPLLVTGRDAVVDCWRCGGFGSAEFGQVRCVVTRVNRQPAVAGYVRKAGDDEFRCLALDVLRIEGGAIADCTTFPLSPDVAAIFGLPPTA